MGKKLIEVALPLERSTLSQRGRNRFATDTLLHCICGGRVVRWQPAERCCIASLVDDPLAHPDKFPTEEDQSKERQRLHDLIGQIVTEEKRGKQVVRGLVSWGDIKNPRSD